MRILVTGSRNLTDYNKVVMAISAALETLYASRPDDKKIVVVHGGAKGADTLAGDFVSQARAYLKNLGYTIKEEIHKADWDNVGKYAGPIRNQRMVDCGADICVAFPEKDSKGTKDCIRRAQRAGIPVEIYNV